FLTHTPVIGCHIAPNPEVNVLTDGTERTFTPRIVINAAGPWADSILGMTGISKTPLLKPTLGIHLVTRPLALTHALLISAASDNRVIFVIPHDGYSIVGTTDTPFDRSPDTAAAGVSDIQYLVAEVQRVFNVSLGPSDIYATFAGLRPLLRSSATTTAAMSRDHALIRHTANFMSIVGGKYTTFRSMAEEVATAIMMGLDRPFSGTTRGLHLPVGPFPTPETRRRSVVDSARYCIRNEFARHLSDFLRRRTDYFFRQGNGLEVVELVADVFASELGWSIDEKVRELSSYRQSIGDMHQQIYDAFN
ncbi:FAD-dependent oxidoreductase, partial [bacterium]|nr:FAD-dependent oxidoreductase [bacterium]